MKVDGGTEGGVSPCAASHVFCVDFDHGAVTAGWDSNGNDAPGTLALDDLALSAPHAMRTTRPRPAMTNLATLLEKQIAMPWRRAIAQTDIYIAQPVWQPGDVNVALMQLTFDSSSSHTGSVFFLDSAKAQGTIEHLPDGPERYLPLGPLASGRWVHIVVDFDPAGHVHYELDGNAFDRDFAAVVAGDNSIITLEIGVLQYNAPEPAMDVRFDNLFLDFP